VWEREFAPLRAANFGIDGDRTQHLLWRLSQGEGEGFSPKAIVLLIGTNNTGFERDGVTPRNTSEEAVQGVALVLQDLRKRWPSANILLLALLPRGNPADLQRRQVAEMNQALAGLSNGTTVKFVDFGGEFLAEASQIRTDLMPDKVHPSMRGYEAIAEKLKAYLQEALAR
jgi:lysophospholipase L1-like esterase